MPSSGSDFVTAPEMTPLFGQALARAGGARRWRPPAPTRSGSSAPAPARWPRSCWRRWATRVRRYTIVDLSGSLRERQQQALAALRRPGALGRASCRERIAAWWSATRCSTRCRCKLLARVGGAWHERGVVAATAARCAWADRPTDAAPAGRGATATHDYLTEIHPQAEAFIRTLADRLQRGRGLLPRLRLPRARVLPPAAPHGHADVPPRPPGRRRSAGGRRARRTSRRTSTSPASRVAAQEAGLAMLGYTSQARFLINCGIARRWHGAPLRGRTRRAAADERTRDGRAVQGDRLSTRGAFWDAVGFRARRPHRTRSDGIAYTARMIRWIIVIFLALMLISWFTPLLQRWASASCRATCASSCSAASGSSRSPPPSCSACWPRGIAKLI